MDCFLNSASPLKAGLWCRLKTLTALSLMEIVFIIDYPVFLSPLQILLVATQSTGFIYFPADFCVLPI